MKPTLGAFPSSTDSGPGPDASGGGGPLGDDGGGSDPGDGGSAPWGEQAEADRSGFGQWMPP